ncbi:MAG: RsfS/YbeB/iojap family protein [Candidatus Omnitrophica bacterium]|nr:RsfS/YbeB/iojap family protein [Candidatus Omnitrophota bacterium]
MAKKLSSLDVARKAAEFAVDKKAENVVVLDMTGVANFCDYFVICSGTIARHVKAIADGVDDGLHDLGIKIKYKQGLNSLSQSRGFALGVQPVSLADLTGAWVLLDMGDVVVHIFEGESREFFALDHLWREATPVEWKKK